MTLLRSAAFPVLRVQTSGHIVWANDAAGRLVGVSASALHQRELGDFLVGGSAAFAAFQARGTDVPEATAFSLVASDGSRRDVMLQLAPLDESDGTTDIVVVGTDVTRSRAMEDAIAEITHATEGLVGRAFLRELVRQLAAAIGCRYVFVGERIGARRAAVRTVALCADGLIAPDIEYELAGTPCELVVDAAPCFHLSGVQALFPADDLLQQMQIESYYGAPLRDAEQAHIGIVVALHDAPLRDEPKLRTLFAMFAARAGAELARMSIEERRRILETDLIRARRLEAIGALAGGIAHDFNNLLTGIRTNVELARLDIAAASAPDRALEQVARTTARAQSLVHDIFRFSETGTVFWSAVDFAALVADVLAETAAIRHPDTQLSVRIAPSVRVIRADASLLHQALLNLVTNAVQAMPMGGHLTVQAEREQLERALVDSTALPAGDYDVITVCDTGSGIPAATLDQIFDPFFSTKKDVGGTGLGLAVVQRVVSAHGGIVRVTSTVDAGTRVRLFLPLQD